MLEVDFGSCCPKLSSSLVPRKRRTQTSEIDTITIHEASGVSVQRHHDAKRGGRERPRQNGLKPLFPGVCILIVVSQTCGLLMLFQNEAAMSAVYLGTLEFCMFSFSRHSSS